jgi:hypothetical protein
VLEKELEEDMAEARRRKLMCFQKTSMGVINKTISPIMTTATATPTVTPDLTPEELVKFMDVAVASKYGNELTNFTHTITEEESMETGKSGQPTTWMAARESITPKPSQLSQWKLPPTPI